MSSEGICGGKGTLFQCIEIIDQIGYKEGCKFIVIQTGKYVKTWGGGGFQSLYRLEHLYCRDAGINGLTGRSG